MNDRAALAAADRLPPFRVDAHQHFWEIESGAYDWPTPADGPIHRNFGPDDLRPELEASGIDRTVVVQAVNTLADTDAMLAAAAAHAWIGGVVGWVPLDRVKDAADAIDLRMDLGLRGIRHLIHHETDPDWLIRREVGDGLALLQARNLAFDVVAVFPDHLRHVPVVADRFPDLVLVIDHLAKPPIRGAGWSQWKDELAAAARRPNVVAKLSGLDTAAGANWTATELRPSVEAALEAFGPERLMFGSDWPVCTLVSGYREVVSAVQELLSALGPGERDLVLGGTATRVYGLR